jgi:branched-chain amino acid transport system ATP-binding protein
MLANKSSEYPQAEQLAILVSEGVSKNFGGVYAVDDVSIHCNANEVIGLIGPNGAGKTTLMNLVSGTLPVDQGEILVNGRRIDGLPPEVCARAGVARTFQNIRVFGKLTVRQNIEVAYTTARRYRDNCYDESKPERVLALLDLEVFSDLKGDTLPYGAQRRVEIARALALSPRVLLLDEPAAGMNEQETESLRDKIKQISDIFGFAIVVIDHDLRFIMNLCDRIYVMHMGRIIAQDEPAAIRSNPMVQEVYLGNRRFDQ